MVADAGLGDSSGDSGSDREAYGSRGREVTFANADRRAKKRRREHRELLVLRTVLGACALLAVFVAGVKYGEALALNAGDEGEDSELRETLTHDYEDVELDSRGLDADQQLQALKLEYKATVFFDTPAGDMPDNYVRNLSRSTPGSPWSHREPARYEMKWVLNIPIGGFKGCSGPNMGNVYYPELPNGTWAKVPVVAWAHGFTQGGPHLHTTKLREGIYRPLVERGYIILASQTGGTEDYCDNSHDQIRMLDWAKQSRFAERIDWGRVMLAGYSMGGRATLKSASNWGVVKKHNVKAAFVVNPHCVVGCKKPVVPTYFSTGSHDMTAPAWYTYRTASSMGWVKRYIAKYRVAHVIEPWQGKWMLSPPIHSFSRCYLKGDQSGCQEMTLIHASNLPDLVKYEIMGR